MSFCFKIGSVGVNPQEQKTDHEHLSKSEYQVLQCEILKDISLPPQRLVFHIENFPLCILYLSQQRKIILSKISDFYHKVIFLTYMYAVVLIGIYNTKYQVYLSTSFFKLLI